MMQFIYFCKDDEGTESSFLSPAFLEPGMRIPADNGRTTVIIDVNIQHHIHVSEDAIDFALEGMV